MIRATFFALAAGVLSLQAAPTHVVSLGGDVTEIAFALGKGDSIAAVDVTSMYPEAALKLPKVGYVSAGVVELMQKQQQGWAYIRP